MKAVVKTSPDDQNVELRDVEPAPLPPTGHARVEVAAAGICGTDLHIIDGSYGSRPPVVLGHEVSGRVVEVSADVDPAWIGTAVALETFYSTCGACEYCRSGYPNMCGNRLSIGSGVDGGFAESLVVPLRNLHRLPDWLDLHAGALCEPLACVCQSLFDPFPAVKPGDRVLVTGPGAVGLLAAQVARAAGAEVLVVGAERDLGRLALARELGLGTRVVPVDRDSLPPEWTQGPDVVIECSGTGAAMRSGLELLRKRGRYVQMGQTGDLVSVPLALVSFKELVITGGFASTPASWARAIRLLEGRQVELSPLLSGTFPLERWEDAFAATQSGDGVKFVLSADPSNR
ncbi:zinc-binding dehydrogenase [Naasia sp. SYSU D00948]|uniref:zinc-dependent alcohol dehydrogenase n=1 Tax=Naasia sp. SYSU D00948 TaxID=2817379 RepID=UPI001B30BF48|nr:alcohol dehydrogenase catalytic domain-containing protein [Naasia sp. SYSU D00948]